MQTLTANEAKTHFGDMLLKAQRAPVQITRSGKPVALVLSSDDYFEYENFKMEALKQIVSQSRNDMVNGNIIDGEVFMQELLDGKHDK